MVDKILVQWCFCKLDKLKTPSSNGNLNLAKENLFCPEYQSMLDKYFFSLYLNTFSESVLWIFASIVQLLLFIRFIQNCTFILCPADSFISTLPLYGGLNF